MSSKTLFLSHDPHPVHRAFAETVNSRVYITPFKKFVARTKRWPWTGHFYAPITAVYSLLIRVEEEVLLVDGGASLYTALALKWRKPQLTLIYLDGDTMFYSIQRAKPYQQYLARKVLRYVDGVISVSEENKKHVTIDVPTRVCPPFPVPMQTMSCERKPYGLFVGRLDPDKNILETIDFALQCPMIEKFYVVGDGVLRAEVESLAREHTKLVYEGYQTDVSPYYNQCQFLFHFPEYDPHPTVTMEAAQAGCIPIMSPGVGSRYLFNIDFTVANTNDYPAINAQLQTLMTDSVSTEQKLLAAQTHIPTKEMSLHQFKTAFLETLATIKS